MTTERTNEPATAKQLNFLSTLLAFDRPEFHSYDGCPTEHDTMWRQLVRHGLGNRPVAERGPHIQREVLPALVAQTQEWIEGYDFSTLSKREASNLIDWAIRSPVAAYGAYLAGIPSLFYVAQQADAEAAVRRALNHALGRDVYRTDAD